MQDLSQLYYQILLIIHQNDFTKLNVKIVLVLLNMKVLRVIWQNVNVDLAIKTIQIKLWKTKKEIQEHI